MNFQRPSGAMFTITLDLFTFELNDAAVCFRHYCLKIQSETRMSLVDSQYKFNSQGSDVSFYWQNTNLQMGASRWLSW